MNAVNRLDERLEERYNSLDQRLRDVEKAISSFKGYVTAIAVVLVIIQIVLRFIDFDISVSSP